MATENIGRPRPLRGHFGVSIAGLVIACGTVAGASLAQPASEPAPAKAKEPATPNTNILVIEHTGLANLLVDPKDQAFKRALGMLTARIDELPGEIDQMPPEAAGGINMALTVLARPARLAATYTAGAPTGGFFNYGMMLSLGAQGQEEAQKLHAMVQMLMNQADVPVKFKPSTRFETMLEGSVMGVGSLAYGPRAVGDAAKGDWRYEVQFGTIHDPDAVSASLPVMTGATPWLRGRLDLSGLTPAVKMLRGAAKNEPDAQGMLDLAKSYGLYGPEGIKASFSVGHTQTHTVSKFVIENATRFTDKWYLNTQTLGDKDFRAVPADATCAMLMKADFNWLQGLLELGVEREPDLGAALAQFKEQTGVDFRNDLIANVGGTVGFYKSLGTGGGGLLSGVALLSFKDRDKFVQAHDKLVTLAHALVDEHLPLGPGYVRVTPWKDGETQLFSLRFNGLPVPLELTYAPLKDWLVVAITPQAAMVAARQAQGKGDAGLAANKLFTGSMPTLDGLGAVTFTDSRRAIADGYGVLSMMGSAIANAVRSPSVAGGPQRDPGVIVPTFQELVRDAKPSVSWLSWDGPHYVVEARGDRSLLVQMAAWGGSLTSALPAMMPMMQGMEGMDINDLVRMDNPEWPGGVLQALMPWTPSGVLDGALTHAR
jgi:hypothetical protein